MKTLTTITAMLLLLTATGQANPIGARDLAYQHALLCTPTGCINVCPSQPKLVVLILSPAQQEHIQRKSDIERLRQQFREQGSYPGMRKE